MSNLLIHTKMQLFLSSEKIYIEPDSKNKTLILDRLSDKISLESNFDNSKIDIIESRTIYGIIGIINLIAGPYLIVITKRNHVGDTSNQSIFQLEEAEIISFRKTTTHLTEKQNHFNNIYINMIKTVLNTPYFYFSYTYDLSQSLQRINQNSYSFINKPLFERADKRFIWNQALLSQFLQDQELISFCMPIIHGFISCNTFFINNNLVKLTIISRRSIHRAGTRLFYRGADIEGNVANFVETEQIIEFKNNKISHIQIRGSIPLIWNQYPTLKYKPKPKLSQFHDQFNVFEKHIVDNQKIYGNIILVSLINNKGQELILGQEFQNVSRKLSSSNKYFRYEPFDFHSECKGNNWSNLYKLMCNLDEDLQKFCYFETEGNSILSLQKGVIRTNCIDSLDRTNVVQNLIAKKILEEVLLKHGIIVADEKLESYPKIEFVYRNVWADNADICSTQYAGTGALKTDYTRTGKRSLSGLLRDGYNSLLRYYKNNFNDGYRQDGIDLFLGLYSISGNEGNLSISPLDQAKDWKYLTLPILLLGSISMFFLSVIIPLEPSTETFFYLMFWSGMIALTGILIAYYGTEFVDFPKLNESIKNECKKATR